MVKRAGCASTDCNCDLHAQDGLTVEGLGTENNPYVITALEGSTEIQAVSTPSIVLHMDGTGTSSDPYVLSGEFGTDPSFPAARVQRFTTSGTWTKPPGTTAVQITVVGGGGGGGAGAGQTGADYLVRGPGMGGGGGGWTRRTFHGTQVPASVPVIVGTGGAGGVAALNSANTPSGAAGGFSRFGGLLSAGGGAAGVLEPQSSNVPPIPTLPITIYKFRGTTEGWAWTAGTGITPVPDGVSFDGQPPGSIRMALSGAGTVGYVVSPWTTVTPGSKIDMFGYSRMASAGTATTLIANIGWNDGSYTEGTWVTLAADQSWVQFRVQGTVPPGATAMNVTLSAYGVTPPASPPTSYTSRVNLMKNGSWETTQGGWTGTGAGVPGRVNITTPYPPTTGVWALRITGNNNSNYLYALQNSNYSDVSPSTTYVLSGFFQRNSNSNWTDNRVIFELDFYDGAFGYLGGRVSNNFQTLNSAIDWYRFHTGAFTTPAGCTIVRAAIKVYPGNIIGPGVYVNIDALLLEPGSGLGPYFDGSSPASGNISYSWTGVPFQSASIETTTVPGTTPPQPQFDVSWVEVGMQGQVKAPTRAQGSEPGGATVFRPGDPITNTYWAPAAGGGGGPAKTVAPASAALGKTGAIPLGAVGVSTPTIPVIGTAGASGAVAPDNSGSGGAGGSGGNGYFTDGTTTYGATSGGAGGYPGGGGGGGGQAVAGQTPGNGGRGADGYVEVVSW